MGLLSFKQKQPQASKYPAVSLDTLMACVEKMCNGDLSVRVDIPENDPLALLAKLINRLADRNAELLVKMSMILNEAVYSSVKTGDSLNQLSQQFHMMNDNIAQVSNAVADVAGSVNNLADSTNQTSEQTIIGKDSIQQTTESVQTVAGETEKSQMHLADMTIRVKQLHVSTANIDGLVEVVKGVSDQTKPKSNRQRLKKSAQLFGTFLTERLR